MDTYFGAGVYSVAEAARLSKVSAGRIRRWLRGYTFDSQRGPTRSPPVWQGSFPAIDGSLALSFLDLTEVRFVDAFLKEGVSWKMMRRGHDEAAKRFQTRHPFSAAEFKTDGRRILIEVGKNGFDRTLIDVVERQAYFDHVVTPISRGLEFTQREGLARWWPLGLKNEVVVDPDRSFGRPIIQREGVPTAVLFSASKAGNSQKEICTWFDVTPRGLSHAIRFENSLAA